SRLSRFRHLGQGAAARARTVICADGHLRGQTEPLADVIVDNRLQLELVRAALRKRHLGAGVAGGIAGGIAAFQRAQEGGMRVRRGREFAEHGLFQRTKILVWSIFVNSLGPRPLPPRPQGTGLPAPISVKAMPKRSGHRVKSGASIAKTDRTRV